MSGEGKIILTTHIHTQLLYHHESGTEITLVHEFIYIKAQLTELSPYNTQ